MHFAIPWIISRRRKLIGISIDCFVNIYLYNFIFNKEIGIYPNQYVSLSLALFWVIVSYVLGRYIKIANITFNSFSKAVIKVIVMLILCNLIYLIINWWLPLAFYFNTVDFSSFLSRKLSNLFIRSPLYISLCSLFVQYFFSIITYNIYDQKRKWIFYGPESQFKKIITEIGTKKRDLFVQHISNENI